MNLTPEGKKRLEKMKKTLAAGLPLAGLLAATVAVGVASEGCAIRQPMGRFPSEPQPEEWVEDGYLVPAEQLPPEVPDVPAVPDVPVDEQKATPAEPQP